MGSKLKTALKQVSLVGGVLQEAAPPLEVEQPGGFLHGNRQKGRLFVLVEPLGSDPDDTAALVRELIGQAYFRDRSLSVTSCLSRAVAFAHRQLRARNELSPPVLRSRAALTCLALKGFDLYCAQVGPSLAYVLHPSLERKGLDQRLAVLDCHPPGPLLGGEDEPEPQFSHHRLPAGGTVALVSGRLRHLDPERVSTALSREPRRALQELYDLAAEGEPLTKLDLAVLQLSGKAEEEPAPIRRLAAQPEERSVHQSWEALSHQRYRRHRSAPPLATGVEDEQPDREAAQIGDRVVAFLESAGGSLKHSTSRSAPGGMAAAAWRLGIVVLLVLSSIWGVRYWQERATAASAEDALSHAVQLEQEAHATQNLPMRRRLLAEAEQLVLQASEIRGGDRQARALKLRIQRELDELSTVLRLRRAAPLADLAALDPKADPWQLVVQGIDIFVLDPKSDRVYKYLLDSDGQRVKPDENPVLLRKGDELGGGFNVGDLATMAWVPNGGARQHSALLALDERGFVVEYDPYRGLTALPVYNPGGWGKVRSIAGYAGNLYLLDVGQHNLLWYPPGPGGYVRMAYNYFHPDVTVNVSTATDLAVDENLYLLYANGKVERYFAGRLQPFTAILPDSPLREGTALCVGAVSKSVYVVDRPGQRIVQFSREGHFIRQLRYGGLPDVFVDLRDLAVDEENQRLYVLNGQTVYLLELPPPD